MERPPRTLTLARDIESGAPLGVSWGLGVEVPRLGPFLGPNPESESVRRDGP